MEHDSKLRRVAIIGGGISGLAAAFRMRELAAAAPFGLELAVYEAGPRAGGPLATVRRDGLVIETGADSFLSEKPAAAALAQRLGLADHLLGTQPQFRRTLVVRDGRLLEIPEGFSLLAPTYLGPLLRSPLFSLTGKARIALEPLIARRRQQEDESLGQFVRRRLGSEVLDRIAQPLAGGIYTADPEQLSVSATMPRFVEMERRFGSVIRGLRAAARARNAEARGTSGARWSLFLSFKDGIGELVDALVARLGDSLRYGAEVVSIAPADAAPAARDRRWRIGFRDGSAALADAIILAAPAYAAAPMLAALDPALAGALAALRYASAATINLAFRTADFPEPPASFGFVVPAREHRRIIAGSFSSLKFPGRAPHGTILMRVFMGGSLQSEMMSLADDQMIAAAREELASLLGVAAEPGLVCLRRWPRSMPQYAVGHLGRVAEIERRAAAIPRFALAGAYLRGVGIPDCIASGEAAAAAVCSALGATTAGAPDAPEP